MATTADLNYLAVKTAYDTSDNPTMPPVWAIIVQSKDPDLATCEKDLSAGGYVTSQAANDGVWNFNHGQKTICAGGLWHEGQVSYAIQRISHGAWFGLLIIAGCQGGRNVPSGRLLYAKPSDSSRLRSRTDARLGNQPRNNPAIGSRRQRPSWSRRQEPAGAEPRRGEGE
jgi:hypothetical protein